MPCHADPPVATLDQTSRARRPGPLVVLGTATVHVIPGPRAEANLDKVAFTWAQGKPGAASLTITYNKGGVMAGTLQASLEAEGFVKDDGSNPVINVTAQFIANEGPLGCVTPY